MKADSTNNDEAKTFAHGPLATIKSAKKTNSNLDASSSGQIPLKEEAEVIHNAMLPCNLTQLLFDPFSLNLFN